MDNPVKFLYRADVEYGEGCRDNAVLVVAYSAQDALTLLRSALGADLDVVNLARVGREFKPGVYSDHLGF